METVKSVETKFDQIMALIAEKLNKPSVNQAELDAFGAKLDKAIVDLSAPA